MTFFLTSANRMLALIARSCGAGVLIHAALALVRSKHVDYWGGS
jgi:hypothetical protein